MADRRPPKSAPKPQPKHRRKLKDVDLGDPNDKAFYLVSACFYFFQRSRSRFIFSGVRVSLWMPHQRPPHLKSYCLPVPIHLRPRDMVFRITLLCSIPVRRFKNKPRGAVSIGSLTVKNLIMVLRVVDEMLCRLPILSCLLPLKIHPATLSRFRIRQQQRLDIPCLPPIYQQYHPMIQPPKIIQSKKHESRQLKNSQIGWARGKPHMPWTSARK